MPADGKITGARNRGFVVQLDAMLPAILDRAFRGGL